MRYGDVEGISYLLHLLIYTRERVGKIAEVAQSLSAHFRERLLVKNSADIGRARRREKRIRTALKFISRAMAGRANCLFLLITR